MHPFRRKSLGPSPDGDRLSSLKPVEAAARERMVLGMRRGGYFTAEYRHPQVIVLPVVEDRAIVMVRVKRPVLDDSTLELPAGGSEPGETPEDCAARELAEETGIAVSSRPDGADAAARDVPESHAEAFATYSALTWRKTSSTGAQSMTTKSRRWNWFHSTRQCG